MGVNHSTTSEPDGSTTAGTSIGEGFSRRRVLQLGAASAGVVAFASLLAACGATTNVSGGGTGGALDPKKKVRVWIQNYGNPEDQNAALKAIASGFKEKTGVTVEFEGIDWSTAEQKWDLAMSNGNLPDIGDMFYLPSRVLQGRGKWGPLDLTKYVDKGDFGDWNRIVESSRSESTLDSKIYGIPWRIDIRAWNHRSDVFDSVPRTLEELETMGLAALAKSDDLQGACTHFAQPIDAFHQGGAAWNVPILTEGYKASNLNDPRWVEVADWMRDMSDKKVFLALSELDGKFNQNGSFYSGATGAIYGGNAIKNEATGVAPQVVPNLVSGLQPAGPGGSSRGLASCAQFSVFENSQSINESVAFLAWLSKNTQMSAKLNQATSSLSADAAVQKLDTDEYNAAFYEQAKNVDLIDMPIVAWNEMRVFPDGPLNVLANKVWGSTQSTKEILAEGHKAINNVLAKY